MGSGFIKLINKIQDLYPDTRIVVNIDIVDSDMILSIDCYSVFNDVKICNVIYKTINIKYFNDLNDSFLIENENIATYKTNLI